MEVLDRELFWWGASSSYSLVDLIISEKEDGVPQKWSREPTDTPKKYQRPHLFFPPILN